MRSFVVAAVAGIAAATPMEAIELKFINYIAEHSKTYATKEEYQMRLKVFEQRDAAIEEINSLETTSVHGHNFLSDRTEYERSKMLGTTQMPHVYEGEYHQNVGAVPDWTTGVDWVTAGAVAPVKDQGQCGSCWAFSSVSCLESAYHIAQNKGTSTVEQFSEQQLVDCVKSCFGCNGGWQGHAFYYYTSHGAYLENRYPYTAKDGTCTYVASQATNVRAASYTKVTPDSYTALQAAIVQQPISISIDAESNYFQSYQSGVLTNAFLCGTTIDHAVVAVGYGQENGINYFLVRNSWSSGWGDKGYCKIAADDSNNGMGVCGIQSGPLYPVV